MANPFKPTGDSCGSLDYALFSTADATDPRNGYCILAKDGLIETRDHFNWRVNPDSKSNQLTGLVLMIIFIILAVICAVLTIMSYDDNDATDADDATGATGGGVAEFFEKRIYLVPATGVLLFGGGAVAMWFGVHNQKADEPESYGTS
jgi:hypothetical protein